jgi:hypothetical protein
VHGDAGLARSAQPPEALRKRPPATPMVTPMPPVSAPLPERSGVSTLGVVLAAIIGAALAALTVWLVMRR